MEFYVQKLKVFYFNTRPNAGDFFSVWLLNKMNFECEFSKNPDICVTGSILGCGPASKCKIWGCGFHNYFDKRSNNKNILAVRGKLTEKILGLKDTTTGDPGILASHFYKSDVKKKYKFGIIAHYVDEEFFDKLKKPTNVTVIHVGTNNIEDLLDKINECEFILSSSLHGIIFAHSFKIPAIRIKHNELATKKSFKFLDYYSNFNLKYIEKSILTEKDMDWDEFELLYKNKKLFVPTDEEIKNNQKNLIASFPYKNED